jgi:hypothetical protein
LSVVFGGGGRLTSSGYTRARSTERREGKETKGV